MDDIEFLQYLTHKYNYISLADANDEERNVYHIPAVRNVINMYPLKYADTRAANEVLVGNLWKLRGWINPEKYKILFEDKTVFISFALWYPNGKESLQYICPGSPNAKYVVGSFRDFQDMMNIKRSKKKVGPPSIPYHPFIC